MSIFGRELLRLWCNAVHARDSVRPSVLGGGTASCGRCGLAYLDFGDAGKVLLTADELAVSAQWLAAHARTFEAVAPTFAAVEWSVRGKHGVVRRWRRRAA